MIEYIQFFPTLKCNQRCFFCFVRDLSISEFPIEKLESFVSILKLEKIKKLDILGGEPFLYEGFFDLVSILNKNQIEVTISTNGTLIEKIEYFLSIFKGKGVQLGISINGNFCNELLELIKKHSLWVKSVMMRNKLPDENLLEFTNKNNIIYYLIYFDAITREDLEISIPFYDYLQKIREIQVKYSNIKPVYCKGFIGGRNYRCPAGTEKITVMPNGDVYPCYLLVRNKDYRIGNIFKDSIKNMLSSQRLRVFKDLRKNPCENTCILCIKCHGGCVAHSIIHYNNPYRSDPRCNNSKIS